MKKDASPTIGLILIFALMFTGLKMLGWGIENGELTANPEKITSKLKILQPKKKESSKTENPNNE